MKTLTILLLILLSERAMSQDYNLTGTEHGIAMGLTGGISSKQSVIGTLSLGTMFRANHLSMNMLVLSEIRNPDVPTIFEGRFGHVFNTVELYAGAGYHIAGTDNKITSNPNTGLRPGFGIIKYFNNSPWIISAGMSGSLFSLQVGVFGIR